MRIEPRLYLAGSGKLGFDLTDSYDCNIFLFDAGDTYVLFDAGTGLGMDQIWDICIQDGVDPAQIGHLFLTHAHADHAGGAAYLRDRTSVAVYASADTARIVSQGDEEAISLPGAREAGLYPLDYAYRACPIDRVLADSEAVTVGDLRIELIATPGHSHDHCSYLVTGLGRACLVSGDAIFHGGRIILQNTYDCSVPRSIASIQRLATYDFEALLPGHLAFSLNRGLRHIQAACDVIDQFGCPAALA